MHSAFPGDERLKPLSIIMSFFDSDSGSE